MRTVVITDPEFLPGETQAVTALLEAGAWRVHVRKPGADAAEVEALLEKLPELYRQRISLHDCHELAARYGVGGVHLNARNPLPPQEFTGMVSRSCHSFEELAEYAPVCDYMFLSPIFDSISKKGYVSRFPLEEIRRIYEEYYSDHSFTFIVDKNPDLKQVVNTNKCLIYLQKIENKLLVISMIDNLLKGASGQAVHNMNLLFGLEESVGLHLKPSAF